MRPIIANPQELVMPIVLVHGVPETAAIWGPLRAELGREDVITWSPPGYGAPVPAGFGATSDDYVHWLIGELKDIEGPIDLVGHDWGGGHVQRVAAARPDLIRSWCTDIAGSADPAYVWHNLAQSWQTDGVGEETIKGTISAPVEARAAIYVQGGMTPEIAHTCAEATDEDMGRCILALYRSAKQPRMTEWGRDLELAERRPGLVIVAAEDAFTGGGELAYRSAERFGARVADLQGLGHWWMQQDPAAGAAVLNDFFATLD
jgi:pimeloyl-ACP methyl ester carboxylesterase